MSLKLLYKKYPGLMPFGMKCFCGIPSKGFKPFISGDFIGIQAADCACGRSGVCRATPINQEKADLWTEKFKNILDKMEVDK